MTQRDDLLAAIERLERYGRARDRETEREPRQVTISDDEAVAIADALESWRATTGRYVADGWSAE